MKGIKHINSVHRKKRKKKKTRLTKKKDIKTKRITILLIHSTVILSLKVILLVPHSSSLFLPDEHNLDMNRLGFIREAPPRGPNLYTFNRKGVPFKYLLWTYRMTRLPYTYYLGSSRNVERPF